MLIIKVYKSKGFDRSIELKNKKISSNISEETVYYLFGIPIFSRFVYSDCISIV
jgi:hypothetical protein